MIETETHIKRHTRKMYSKRGNLPTQVLQASVPMGSVWIYNVDRKHALASEVPLTDTAVPALPSLSKLVLSGCCQQKA